MMRLVEEPIVQLVDRHTGRHVQPGEVGEVVVTNLNPTYPLIRFGTGDLALYHDPAPGVSRQQERAIRLIGRVGDAVKVRGMFVHPNQLRAALTPFGVAAFAAFVRRPATRDEFVLRLVADDEAKSQQERLLATVREFCRVSVDVVEWVDELGEQAGKIVDERRWDA
jgi:phenylacetate-CoA ligase